jgi:anti-anti-sigma factor
MQETVSVTALREAGNTLCLVVEGEMDSTALGMLVHLAKRLEERGGKLTLVISHPPIHKLFSITALDRHFTICETREEALKRF